MQSSIPRDLYCDQEWDNGESSSTEMPEMWDRPQKQDEMLAKKRDERDKLMAKKKEMDDKLAQMKQSFTALKNKFKVN